MLSVYNDCVSYPFHLQHKIHFNLSYERINFRLSFSIFLVGLENTTVNKMEFELLRLDLINGKSIFLIFISK